MNALAKQQPVEVSNIERLLIQGDLSPLTPNERVTYYREVCSSLNLNPLTKPFQYITLNNKLTLYATKDCTDQLRSIREVSLKIVSKETIEGVYVVTADAKNGRGREDSSTGAVNIQGLKGEALANAFMKAETKAKRRVTLSICGLGMLDESEVDSIPGATIQHTEVVEQKALAAPKSVASNEPSPFDDDENPFNIVPKTASTEPKSAVWFERAKEALKACRLGPEVDAWEDANQGNLIKLNERWPEARVILAKIMVHLVQTLPSNTLAAG